MLKRTESKNKNACMSKRPFLAFFSVHRLAYVSLFVALARDLPFSLPLPGSLGRPSAGRRACCDADSSLAARSIIVAHAARIRSSIQCAPHFLTHAKLQQFGVGTKKTREHSRAICSPRYRGENGYRDLPYGKELFVQCADARRAYYASQDRPITYGRSVELLRLARTRQIRITNNPN